MALVAAWLMNETSGTTAAEYNGNTALDFALTNVTMGVGSPVQGGIDFGNAANDYARIVATGSPHSNAPLKLSAPFSIAMRVTMGADATRQSFLHVDDDGTNYTGYNILTNSSAKIEFMYGDNTGSLSSSRRSFLGSALSASTQYDILVVCTDDSGSATGVTIYLDGSAESLTTSGSGGAIVYTGSPTSCGEWITSSRNAEHIQRYIAIWDHALTSSDATDLVNDHEAFITGGGSAGNAFYYMRNQ